MIKLIVCDLDGTLLNSNQELTPYNAQMLKRAQALGIEYMLATGRNSELIRPFLNKYGLKCGCILMNGAEVRNKENVILCTNNVDKRVISSLHGILTERGYFPFYTTNKGVYYKGHENDFRIGIGYRQQCLDRKCKGKPLDEAIEIGMATQYAKSAMRISEISDFYSDEIEIRKIVVFHTDVQKNMQTIGYLESQFTNLAIAGSYPENIEINDYYAQKGYGLKKVLDVMGIREEEVAVFGDGLNDASMFRIFTNSFATANAVPCIKELAHEIIGSNDEDGVGKKIEDILGIME